MRSSWFDNNFKKYFAGVGVTSVQFLNFSQNSISHSAAFLIAIGFGCSAHKLIIDPFLINSEE